MMTRHTVLSAMVFMSLVAGGATPDGMGVF